MYTDVTATRTTNRDFTHFFKELSGTFDKLEFWKRFVFNGFFCFSF